MISESQKPFSPDKMIVCVFLFFVLILFELVWIPLGLALSDEVENYLLVLISEVPYLIFFVCVNLSRDNPEVILEVYGPLLIY